MPFGTRVSLPSRKSLGGTSIATNGLSSPCYVWTPSAAVHPTAYNWCPERYGEVERLVWSGAEVTA